MTSNLKPRLDALEQSAIQTGEPELPPEKLAEIDIAVNWWNAHDHTIFSCGQLQNRFDIPPNESWSDFQKETYFSVMASIKKLDSEI